MNINTIIKENTVKAIKALFAADVSLDDVSINETRKEFEGDATVLVFPFVRVSKKKPEETGEIIGAYLVENVKEITAFNVVKGFLNLSIANEYWVDFFKEENDNNSFGKLETTGKKIILEYCGPNTNKPLHLGHIRNMLLGFATANLLEAAGNQVHKVNIYNDRGIAICKSMLAWQKFGNGETPESTGMKGDHFVGKYYVEFAKKSKEQLLFIKQELNNSGWFTSEKNNLKYSDTEKIQDLRNAIEKIDDKRKLTPNEANVFDVFFDKINKSFATFENPYKTPTLEEFIDEFIKKDYSLLFVEATQMLIKWEAGDKEVLKVWNDMNDWVYEGFETTFKNLGVDFERHYKESDYYIKGRDFVIEGEKKKIFKKKDDGAIYVNLSDVGLDEKILVRSDGTSVYITQDMGIAQARYEDYTFDQMIYVVGQEQDYHFQVLKEVIKKLGNDYSDSIMHFSYGMVSLPEGKMKSREGTVVDADDLIASMIETATEHTKELGKVDDLDKAEVAELNRKIALAALKFFILKVNPKKGVMFNPKESIDFQGNTGPFIQYTYTRINSMTSNNAFDCTKINSEMNLDDAEKELIKELHKLPFVIENAATNYDVSELTTYIYSVAKAYNKFYAACPILKADTEAQKNFRLCLSAFTGKMLKQNLAILGIEVPERM